MNTFSARVIAAISLARISYAATSTSAAIGLNLSTYVEENRSDYSRSFDYEENTSYQPCTCDKTFKTCDAYCCCDQDCQFNTRAVWLDDMKCLDQDFDSAANGLSLSDCITRKELYEYNRKKGLTNYIDPFAQLFCVRFNHAPKMDTYWQDVSELTVEDINELRTDDTKKGFLNSFFGTDETVTSSVKKAYYNQGDRMRSQICDTSEPPVCNSQYLDAFPVPHPNIYGMCNNYSSAVFMESTTNECTQIVDLATECESTLNPEYYTNRLRVLKGQLPRSADELPVEITGVYKLSQNAANPNSFEYIQAADAVITPSVLTLPDPDNEETANLYTCGNVLKEIAYTVNVSEAPADDLSSSNYLKVDSVSALVIVSDAPVTASLNTDTGKAMSSVHQRFSIKFVKQGDPEGVTISTSGNPGYIDGLPLLLGKATESGAMQIDEDGLRIRGGDSVGSCIQKTDSELIEMGDPTVRFGVDLSYGCNVQYNWKEFVAMCDSDNIINPVAQLEIFKNLKQVDSFGRFGNAYIYYSSDWEPIKIQNSFDKLGEKTWLSSANTCIIYANVVYKIYYAEMGFSENLQKYIVAVEKYSTPIDWIFNRKTTIDSEVQNFQVGVSFQYVKVVQADIDGDTESSTTSWWSLDEDLFYAFGSKSGATLSHSVTLATAATLILLSMATL